jgi:hypothetical protein
MDEQLYISNKGKGQQVARIVKVENERVYLEYRALRAKANHWQPFDFRKEFWDSQKHGWRKTKHNPLTRARLVIH